MDFFELIEKRISCRDYLPAPVEEEKLLRCVAAARLAPSARNMQPWYFLIVTEAETRRALSALLRGPGTLNAFTETVPAFLVLCGRPEVPPPDSAFPPPKNNYTQNDLGIAVSYLLLAATELGLGSCMIGWFDEPEVRAALPVPPGYTVHGVVAVGYPGGARQAPRPRVPLDTILRRV